MAETAPVALNRFETWVAAQSNSGVLGRVAAAVVKPETLFSERARARAMAEWHAVENREMNEAIALLQHQIPAGNRRHALWEIAFEPRESSTIRLAAMEMLGREDDFDSTGLEMGFIGMSMDGGRQAIDFLRNRERNRQNLARRAAHLLYADVGELSDWRGDWANLTGSQRFANELSPEELITQHADSTRSVVATLLAAGDHDSLKRLISMYDYMGEHQGRMTPGSRGAIELAKAILNTHFDGQYSFDKRARSWVETTLRDYHERAAFGLIYLPPDVIDLDEAFAEPAPAPAAPPPKPAEKKPPATPQPDAPKLWVPLDGGSKYGGDWVKKQR